MPRRKKPEWLKVVVKGKYPERPLNENERLAVAMGYLQCQFTETEKVVWCDRSKHMSQAEFARVWPIGHRLLRRPAKAIPRCNTLAGRGLFRYTIPNRPNALNPFPATTRPVLKPDGAFSFS